MIQIVVLALAALIFVVMTGASLPEFAATRFGMGGDPNAFMSGRGYTVYMSVLVTVVPLLVALLPRLIGRRWPQLLNISNRDHWLAPERLTDTLAAIESRTKLLATVMILFLCFVHWLVVRANTANPPRLDESLFLVGLGSFAVFMISWIIAFRRRFRIDPARQ
jgi:hypothetical protein